MVGGSGSVHVDRDEIVGLASRLIAIPSPSGEEHDVMDEVVRWCAASGIDHRVIACDTAHRTSLSQLATQPRAHPRHERAP